MKQQIPDRLFPRILGSVFLAIACLAVAACDNRQTISPDQHQRPATNTQEATPQKSIDTQETSAQNELPTKGLMMDAKQKTEDDWKRILTPEQFRVTRQKGTEKPFTGQYWNTTTDGVYHCTCCGAPLFDSQSKFDAGCGWPSFSKAIADGNIHESPDTSLGMTRTEVTCQNCGAHLGHLFDDGPRPTGLRYCINSASLQLTPRGKAKNTPNKPQNSQ